MRSYIKVQVRYDRPQPVDRRMQSARQTMVNTLSVSAQQGPARAEKEMKRGSTCTEYIIITEYIERKSDVIHHFVPSAPSVFLSLSGLSTDLPPTSRHG